MLALGKLSWYNLCSGQIERGGQRLRNYELVMIISPDVAEEDVPGTIEKVTQIVTSKGGAIVEVAPWGRRKLAYPINHFKEGNYVLTRFKLEPGMTAELEASLQISGDILRHLIVRVDDKQSGERGGNGGIK